MAQRKAAAARAAARRAANPATLGHAGIKGAHTNAIVGVPGTTLLTPALTADQLYFSSIYPNYAFSPLPNPADTVNCHAPNYCGIRKFVDRLATLGAPNDLGQAMSIAVPDTKTFPNSDYYEISLRDYYQQMHKDLPIAGTHLRGYVQTNLGTDLAGNNTVVPPSINYLGPLIIAKTGRPVRVKFINDLPSVTNGGNLFIPVDTTSLGAGLGFTKGGSTYLENRATVHLHGGNTPWISDGTPHQWTIPAVDWNNTAYQRGVSAQFVPDMFFLNGVVVPQCGGSVTTNCSGGTAAQMPVGATNDPGNGALTFYYTNQQSARLMFYHDHSYGTTRLNVYAGEAAGYLITDQVEADMVAGTDVSGVFAEAKVTPAPIIPSVEIPLVIQEKTFVPANPTRSPIISVALLAGGSGYTAPTVSFTGGGCSLSNPPTATVEVGSVTNPFGVTIDGVITDITLTNPGTIGEEGAGCTSDPTVVITDSAGGHGTGAAAFASLATLSQQDPTWDAALWGGLGNLWYPHVYMPNEWPGNPDGSEMNPMGRWDYAAWTYPNFKTTDYLVRGEIPCPTTGNPAMMCPGTPTPLAPAPTNRAASAPGGAVPFQGAGSTVSTTPEAFLDTPIVNGTPYPTLTVDPVPTRFRILSAANDRTFNLSWFLACGLAQYPAMAGEFCPLPTVNGIATGTEVGMVPAVSTDGFPSRWPEDGRPEGVPDPAAAGPSWLAIGNEAGVLPAPVVIPPTPISYDMNSGSATFLNSTTHSLNLMPAERADVIVDFTGFAGKTLILYNDAPAPFPGGDSRYDFYTGDPDQTGMGGAPRTLAGFGPNTRTIMQVKVRLSGGVAVDTTPLAAVLPAAFKISQPVPVVPEPVYNKVYNPAIPFTNHFGKFQASGMTFTPINGTNPVTVNFSSKSINEQFELNFGRLNATLGTGPSLAFIDPATETMYDSAGVQGQPVGVAGDGSQIWMVNHYGVDSHAMHFHLYDVEVLNRYGWDGTPRPADPLEAGWKDTVRMNPKEITFVALRPMSQNLPFSVPDSVHLADVTQVAGVIDPEITPMGPEGQPVSQTNMELNLGWEYVWHCHILGHEEADMMRDQVFQVPPQTPVNLAAARVSTGNSVTFTDMSASEAGFDLDRADDNLFTVNVTHLGLPAAPGWNVPVTYVDTTATSGVRPYYRVRTSKPDVNFYAPGVNLTSAWSTPAQLPPASVNIGVTPTAEAFGNQRYGTVSFNGTAIKVSNTGTDPLTINSITITGTNPGDFSKTTTCGTTLAGGSTCTISARFVPMAVGARTATVAISSNDPVNPTVSVVLRGTGTAAPLTITASSAHILEEGAIPAITPMIVGLVAPDNQASLVGLTCSTTYTTTSLEGTYPSTCSGAVNANYTFTYVAGTVTVTGQSTTTVIASHTPNPTALGQTTLVGFQVSPQTSGTPNGSVTVAANSGETCTGTLNAGVGSCVLTFKTVGAKTITATYVGGPGFAGSVSAAVSHQVSALTLTVSPTGEGFGNFKVGTTSGNGTAITVRNLGAAAITINSVLAGAFPGDYSKTTTCGSTLGAGLSCTISVRFSPKALGSRPAAVNINTSDPFTPLVTVILAGTGI